jgi:hypothetical protein
MFIKKRIEGTEALKTELARRKAQLCDVESNKTWLPLEREAALRRRVAELEYLMEKITAEKRGKALPM